MRNTCTIQGQPFFEDVLTRIPSILASMPTATWEQLHSGRGVAWSLSVNAAGTYAATCDQKTVFVIDLKADDVVLRRAMKGRVDQVTFMDEDTISVSVTGRAVVGIGVDGQSVEVPCLGQVRHLRSGPVGVWAAASAKHVWRVADSRKIEFGSFSSVQDIDISRDGKVVAAAQGKTVRVFGADGAELRTLTAAKSVRCLALSSNGALLAVALKDRGAQYFSVESGDEVQRVETGDLTALCVLGKAAEVLQGWSTGYIDEVTVGEKFLLPRGRSPIFEGNVFAFACSADETTVLAAGDGGLVRRIR